MVTDSANTTNSTVIGNRRYKRMVTHNTSLVTDSALLNKASKR